MATDIIAMFRELNQGLYTKSLEYASEAQKRHCRKNPARAGAQTRARHRVAYEIEMGRMICPVKCVTCDRKTRLVAHHWRGYDFPLDVWWLCQRCNCRLPKHDGSISLEQARKLVKDW